MAVREFQQGHKKGADASCDPTSGSHSPALCGWMAYVAAIPVVSMYLVTLHKLLLKLWDATES